MLPLKVSLSYSMTPQPGVSALWVVGTTGRVPGVFAEKREPNNWYAQLPPLRLGVYAYGFVVDGEHWVEDPTNPYKISNGFGGFNSILEV